MKEINLASEISDFVAHAKGLEATRQGLVRKILAVARIKIIPELAQLLPSRYSFDTDRTEVYGVGGDPLPFLNMRKSSHGEVPNGFGVSLRLLYDGQPIENGEEGSDGIRQIQNDLKHKLEELAQKYKLNHVIPLGEPIR